MECLQGLQNHNWCKNGEDRSNLLFLKTEEHVADATRRADERKCSLMCNTYLFVHKSLQEYREGDTDKEFSSGNNIKQ